MVIPFVENEMSAYCSICANPTIIFLDQYVCPVCDKYPVERNSIAYLAELMYIYDFIDDVNIGIRNIAAGLVMVNGRLVENPAQLVAKVGDLEIQTGKEMKTVYFRRN